MRFGKHSHEITSIIKVQKISITSLQNVLRLPLHRPISLTLDATAMFSVHIVLHFFQNVKLKRII